MKKLYAFLIALVALGVISSGVVQAQSYTSTSYLVHKVDVPDGQGLGSGPNWSPQTLTTDATGELAYYAQVFGDYSGYGHQMPFNFRLGNQQLTTANTFTISCAGDVILDPGYSATEYYYPFDGYAIEEIETYGTSPGVNFYNYAFPEFMEDGPYNEGSYEEYPAYTLLPFCVAGEAEDYIPDLPSNPTKFSYGVLGSAPNRELVIEVDGMHTGWDGLDGNYNTYTSFQTVIYEAGISAFQFNYGPVVGTNPFGFDVQEGWAPLNFGDYHFPGSWDEAPAYNEGSYALVEDYGGMCGMKLTANNYLEIDFNGNGWNASNQFVVGYNTPYGPTGTPLMCDTAAKLPQSSIRIAVAYPYDFTAGTIAIPINEDPYTLAAPITPTATITNSGSSIPTSLQVNYTISEVGVGQVYNQTQTILAANLPGAFSSKTITFPTYTPGAAQVPPLPGTPGSLGNNGYGIYEDTMIVFNLLPTPDQNPGDNESTNEWICSPANDIKAVQIISPSPGSATQIDVPTQITIRFRNLGTQNQTNVPLTATVHDATGKVVFRDTVIVPNWPSGQTGGNSLGTQDRSTNGTGPGTGPYYDTAFPYNAVWTPSTQGVDTVFGIAIMSNDQLRLDDTTKTATPILQETDIAAISVVNPVPGNQEAYKTNWPPAGVFQDVGVVDLLDFQIEAVIRRCSDNQIVFMSDTTETSLNVDDGQARFYFPTDNGIYHISQIPPGCYNLCVIGAVNGDNDAANDTACEQFSIIDRLKGNYYVGVGQQFQSIHQAVDTMKFRGIGGNVNLILTDSAYHENGLTDASSQRGAIDFGGINGLSDTSTVTWLPYPGKTPHIYFSGSQPFCFYLGDVFGGFMKWEGYNPSTVPTPDLLVAEPAKRGMTIVNNETNNGAVFGLEYGIHNITLKDLIIHGNGGLTNGGFASDSCAAVRIYNDHNLSTYSSGIHDTIAIQYITVNNCELGNAKYGIYDHGYHDAFDARKGGYTIWRNHNNLFTRNTIGTVANPLSYAGIQFNNENGLVISHNEISNVTASVIPKAGGAAQNVFGILQPSITTYIGPTLPLGNAVWPGDTGNTTGCWLDANRIRNIASIGGSTYGIAVQQSSYQYTSTGLTPVKDTLPNVTQNRVTNNMVLDLSSGSGGVYPILMNTAASTYSADLDSVFNNSISTSTATQNVTMQYEKHVFLWNNIIQNTGNGPYTNYWLEVPRPYAHAISSDYNLFDLRNKNNFDSVIEYDVRYGTVFQRLYFRRLNDWRTYVGQDVHSLTGDPLFATPAMGTDSLHMPPALTYVESPASNNGAWLGTATMARDFDGDMREATGPDIGADEWDGFQFTNDLAVLEIAQPAGFSQTSDTAVVTTQSPLWVNAVVKNLSSVGVYNVPVTATVQRSVGGVWTTVPGGVLTSAPLTWQVGEAKNVILQGPALTAANDTGVFQVIVTVPNDQDNANNSQTKAFRILLKQNAVLLSYNGANSNGTQNRDSVILALNRLGVPFDTIDRNAPKGLPNTTIIDYTPWWAIVWAMGDPGVAPVAGQPTGQGGLTLQETDEITRYLGAAQTYAKKSIVIAGQNIAWYNGFIQSNNPVTDTQWMQSTMHTVYYANSPVSGSYNGNIVGQQPAFWTFADGLKVPTGSETNLTSYLSPDVLLPALTTPAVGPIVNGYAYTYSSHSLTPADSGAGISYYDPLVNTVFYGFDWANPYQTSPGGNGDTTSGTTRTLAAAFAFFRGHGGIILPISNINASVQRFNGNAAITWTVTGLTNVVRYNVEQQIQNTWTAVGKSVTATDNTSLYGATENGIDPAQSYTYRVAAVDESGNETYSNTVELGPDPSELGFTLGQSYPNPSQGVTEVSFTLPEASQITLRVMDVTGKVVNSDVSNVQFAAGSQSVKLDLSALPSGSYLYEMIATGADGRSATLSSKLTIEKN